MKIKSSYPLVSVVIPVFNGARYLVEAVTSVQKSTYRYFEILLIDDGSTDASKKICKRLERQYTNIRYFDFRKNRGLGRVLNFALKKAKGKYICRLNQDDRMLPDRLEIQVSYMENNPDVVALGSSIKLFDERGKSQIIQFLPNDDQIKKVWHLVSPFSDPSVIYRKDIAIKVGGYDQKFWPADDTHLWYRMGMMGKLENFTKKPLVEVRWHDKAASMFYFRRLAISTYKMHRWANMHIRSAGLHIQLYWIIQLIAGLVLPPRLNWKVYRILKKIINVYVQYRNYFLIKKITKVMKVPNTVIQPIIASRSGK